MLIDTAAAHPVAIPLVARYGEREAQTVRQKLAPYLRSASLLNRGHVAYQSARQDLQGSIALYRRAAAVNPNDPEIARLIDLVSDTRRRTLDAYQAAAASDAASATLLHDYGVMLLDAGQSARAAAVLARVATLEPRSADAHLALTRALRDSGDRAGARAALDRAVALDPSRAEAWFERGVLDQQDGRLTAARDSFETALRLRPALYQARFNLGTVFAGLGQLSDARAAYESGLAGDPDQPVARINLAQILLQLGERTRAIEELRRAGASDDPVAARARALLADLSR